MNFITTSGVDSEIDVELQMRYVVKVTVLLYFFTHASWTSGANRFEAKLGKTAQRL